MNGPSIPKDLSAEWLRERSRKGYAALIEREVRRVKQEMINSAKGGDYYGLSTVDDIGAEVAERISNEVPGVTVEFNDCDLTIRWDE